MVSAPAKPPLEAAKCWLPAVPVVARNSLPERDCSTGADPEIGASKNPIEVIRKRADFVAANRGKRYVTPSFVLLAYQRREEHVVPVHSIRFGITVTKKIGNAVVRNRMKRRFRALLQEVLPEYGLPGVDHIMIGRKADKEQVFADMQTDLQKGLEHLGRKLGIQ